MKIICYSYYLSIVYVVVSFFFKESQKLVQDYLYSMICRLILCGSVNVYCGKTLL